MGGIPGLKGAGRGLAERCPAAILYAELRNFTRMSEILDGERVLQLVSAFFTLASDAIRSHGGEMVSLHNDSFLAAFRTGKPAQVSTDALHAAQDLLREFAPLAERWQSDYGLGAAMSAGIHLGETVFGMAGPKGGEQYVAFGDSLSIAERLMHRARAGEIVLTAEVIKAFGPRAAELGVQPLPSLELGRRPAFPIYGILLDSRLDFT
jgi:adenylate cyclase